MSRTFLVTAASKGIGRAVSERLAQAGHQVIGIARNAPEGDFPGEFVPLDLSDSAGTRSTFAKLAERHQIDGIVNNVGLVRVEPLGGISLENFDAVMQLNLHPAILAAEAALPQMKTNGWGRIVNVSSLTILGVPGRTAYAAAKAALVSFTRTWALELAASGITVNAVAPGPTETELFRQNNPVGSDSEQRYLSGVPMGRFGKPDEIAAAISFLLSDEAAYITGQTLHVDGGASIGKAAF